MNEMGNGNLVLYNTRTGAAATIEKENVQLINELLENTNEYIESEFFLPLYKNGFIVKNDYNEYEDIRSKYERNFYNDDLLNIVLLPAEMCNFTCPYCFVYNYKNKIMDEEVYRNVKKHIRNQVNILDNKRKKKDLKISWFGGEPLLEKEKIFSFMGELHDEFSDTCNIHSSIITNGYDLNYSVFRKLLDRGVSRYQITFDGSKESHDTLRRLHNGEGSYDIIVKNLNEIVSNVKEDDRFVFAIRINFLKNTYERIFNLIDDLFMIIGNDKRFQVYCRPIYNFETKREDINEIESDIFTITDGLKVQNNFTQYITKKSNKTKEYRMINDYLPLPTVSWCAEDNMYSIIVGSDGSIYACDSLIGDESVCIGKLDNEGNINYNEKSKEWRKNVFEFSNFEECKVCKCLPICVGSCKRERIGGEAKPCLWTEDDILSAMRNYYTASRPKRK